MIAFILLIVALFALAFIADQARRRYDELTERNISLATEVALRGARIRDLMEHMTTLKNSHGALLETCERQAAFIELQQATIQRLEAQRCVSALLCRYVCRRELVQRN